MATLHGDLFSFDASNKVILNLGQRDLCPLFHSFVSITLQGGSSIIFYSRHSRDKPALEILWLKGSMNLVFCVPHQMGASKRRKINSSRGSSSLELRRQEDLANIDSWEICVCCKRNCAVNLGEMSRDLRAVFLDLCRDERKRTLASFVKEVNGAARFVISGVVVCDAFVIGCLDGSKTLISNVLGRPSANASQLPGRNGVNGREGSASKKAGIIAFLNILADKVSDEMPNKSERHLPYGNKIIVYALYRDNEVIFGRQAAESSFFYHTWKHFLSHIKCMKHHGFTVCDTCVMLKSNLQRLAPVLGAEKERGLIKKQLHQHLDLITFERAEYRRVRSMATEQPNRVLSVIIDGADQAKFALPRFPQSTKRETGKALKQKVTGVLFHGSLRRTDFLSLFTSAENIPGGANQTIDALCRALFAVVDLRQSSGLNSLAPDLYIQLDNTSKDNKNRFFFAFCDYMVHTGLFDKVTVNFLPVGHTHEDIDRRFSRISVAMKSRAVVSIPDLHEVLRSSRSDLTPPFVSRIDGMQNFSGALSTQGMVSSDTHNMTSYRKFVFQREVAGDNMRLVSCKVANRMIDTEGVWSELPRKEGYIGTFLKRPPRMEEAPDIEIKRFTNDEIRDFRKRIDTTETRINDRLKSAMLRNEVVRLETRTSIQPEWDFRKLSSLRIEHEEDETGNESGDDTDGLAEGNECQYDEGDMVTVNCGGEATDATLFWLAQVLSTQRMASGSLRLTVQWYQLKDGQRGSGTELCFRGIYEPMSADDFDEITASSVMCRFDSLTGESRIPRMVQRMTHENLENMRT